LQTGAAKGTTRDGFWRDSKNPLFIGFLATRDDQPLTGTETAIAWGIAILFFVGLIAVSWYVRRDDYPRHNQPEGPMQ
jgi:hypothetical protein